MFKIGQKVMFTYAAVWPHRSTMQELDGQIGVIIAPDSSAAEICARDHLQHVRFAPDKAYYTAESSLRPVITDIKITLIRKRPLKIQENDYNK